MGPACTLGACLTAAPRKTATSTCQSSTSTPKRTSAFRLTATSSSSNLLSRSTPCRQCVSPYVYAAAYVQPRQSFRAVICRVRLDFLPARPPDEPRDLFPPAGFAMPNDPALALLLQSPGPEPQSSCSCWCEPGGANGKRRRESVSRFPPPDLGARSPPPNLLSLPRITKQLPRQLPPENRPTRHMGWHYANRPASAATPHSVCASSSRSLCGSAANQTPSSSSGTRRRPTRRFASTLTSSVASLSTSSLQNKSRLFLPE